MTTRVVTSHVVLKCKSTCNSLPSWFWNLKTSFFANRRVELCLASYTWQKVTKWSQPNSKLKSRFSKWALIDVIQWRHQATYVLRTWLLIDFGCCLYCCFFNRESLILFEIKHVYYICVMQNCKAVLHLSAKVENFQTEFWFDFFPTSEPESSGPRLLKFRYHLIF